MKKLRKFLNTKGGMWAVIGTIAFILLIPVSLFLSWGITNNWDWELLRSYFTNEYAITCYIGGVLIIFLVIILYLTAKLREDV